MRRIRLGDLGQHARAEPVARLREGERDVGVQALELAGVAGAANPGVERCPVVDPRPARRELAANPLLDRRGVDEVGAQRRARRDGGAPTLDAAGRLEPGDGGNEMTGR